MKKNYDFSNAVKNPYAKKLKKTICINISESVLAYFKELAEKTNIPYQTLINMFLEQAKAEKMEPRMLCCAVLRCSAMSNSLQPHRL